MRIGPAVAWVCVVLLAGCSGPTSNRGGGTTAPSAPTAMAGGPYTGTSGTAVSFSAAGSSDPEGQTLTYAWNFGDSLAGTGASPTHTYATAGTYTVSLTVTDTSGLSGTATAKATIAVAPLADVALTGSVTSGAQPVVGAHVYLFAAGTTGYGGTGIAPSASNSSVSLESAARTGTVDSIGAYVLSGVNGQFSLTGDYSCTSGQQLYLYSLGGTVSTAANSAIGMLASVGTCPASTAGAISTTVNEVSTVAAAYALAGFATDATHVGSSGTALAQVGIANAFANAGNLATLSTGVALATTPAGNGTVPQAEINTLANILAGCVDASSASASACTTLFADAESSGSTGTVATDTAGVAINIAHNPGANVAGLYGLGSGTTFSPGLTAAPNDWTVAINLSEKSVGSGKIVIDESGHAWIAVPQLNEVIEYSSSGGLISGYTGGGMNGPDAIAIDGTGDAWIANFSVTNFNSSITEASSSGSILSATNGYTGGGLTEPIGIAIDGTGNVWTQAYGGFSLAEFSSSGSPISGPSGYTGSGLDGPMAIDSAGTIWIASNFGYSLIKISNAGSILASYPVGNLGEPSGMAIDGSGRLWITDAANSSIAELSSSGVVVSGGSGYTGGGIYRPGSIAIDGAGNAWITSHVTSTVSELSSSGVPISGANGFIGGGLSAPISIAVDGSGNLWVANNSGCIGNPCNSFSPDSGSITVFVGAAVPVVTPLAVGVKNNMLGMRP